MRRSVGKNGQIVKLRWHFQYFMYWYWLYLYTGQRMPLSG